jgi:hypothetical protein
MYLTALSPRLFVSCRGSNGSVPTSLLAELGIRFSDIGTHCRSNGGLGRSISVPLVRVVIDGVVTHELSKASSQVSRLSPLLSMRPGGHAALTNVNPSIHTLLQGCQRLPIRAVRAVGTTSGPAGSMQHGGLCMLVVYGKRTASAGSASPLTSLPLTGAAATEGTAPPVEPWDAGGLGQCLLLTSNAAQEMEPQPMPEVMATAIEQAAGQAGAECEGTLPEPLNTPTLTFSPLPAPAVAADVCMGLDFGMPGSSHQEPAVPSDDDADDLQAPAPLMLEGPATAQPQMQVSGLHVDGSSSQLARAGHSKQCVLPPVVRSAIPHVVPAVPDVAPATPRGEPVLLPPAGDECQLPDDFLNAYGIRSTQVLTTSKAPAW